MRSRRCHHPHLVGLLYDHCTEHTGLRYLPHCTDARHRISASGWNACKRRAISPLLAPPHRCCLWMRVYQGRFAIRFCALRTLLPHSRLAPAVHHCRYTAAVALHCARLFSLPVYLFCATACFSGFTLPAACARCVAHITLRSRASLLHRLGACLWMGARRALSCAYPAPGLSFSSFSLPTTPFLLPFPAALLLHCTSAASTDYTACYYHTARFLDVL